MNEALFILLLELGSNVYRCVNDSNNLFYKWKYFEKKEEIKCKPKILTKWMPWRWK